MDYVFIVVHTCNVMQSDQSQYDSCNASAGSGLFLFNGFCLEGDSLQLTLSRNSKSLSNTVNFENNRIYYLTSKYT